MKSKNIQTSVHFKPLHLFKLFRIKHKQSGNFDISNKIWTKIGIYLGKIIAPIKMIIIFFLVVYPTNLILKIFRKDILKINNNDKKSYWIKKEKNTGTMDQQF